MPFSFDKSFKKRQSESKGVPKVILDYLNNNLVGYDLEYYDEAGNCKIRSKSGKYTVGGMALIPPKELKDVTDNRFTVRDILQYSYNAQKKVSVRLEKKDTIVLNGKEIKIGDLEYNPLKWLEQKAERIYLLPQPMNEHFKAVLSGGNSAVELRFDRIPDNSIDWVVFKNSDRDYPLSFLIKVNTKEDIMRFSVSNNLRSRERARDIADSMVIYNAFITGEGKINGYQVIPEKKAKTALFDEDVIMFWEKTAQVELSIKRRFDIVIKDVKKEDIDTIEYLYASLIENKPKRISDRPKSISIEGPSEETMFEVNKHNKMFGIYFTRKYTLSVFKRSISLYEIRAILSCKFESYETKGNKLIAYFADADENHKRYSIGMLFKSQKDMIDYEKKNNIMEVFSKIES